MPPNAADRGGSVLSAAGNARAPPYACVVENIILSRYLLRSQPSSSALVYTAHECV